MSEQMGNAYSERRTIAFQSLFILLLLFGSLDWIIVGLPFIGKHFAFMISEVLLVFIAASIYLTSRKKRKLNHSCLISIKGKPVELYTVFFKLSLVLGVYISVIAAFRILSFGFNSDYFTYPRVSLVFILTFYIMNMVRFHEKAVKFSLLFFLLTLSVLQGVYFLVHGELRLSTIAININIHTCIMAISLPFLLSLLMKRDTTIVFKLITELVFTSQLVFSVLSGSRQGFLSCIVSVVLFILLNRKAFGLNFILRISAGIIIAIAALVYTYSTTLIPYTKATIRRSTMLDVILKIEGDDLIAASQKTALIEAPQETALIEAPQKTALPTGTADAVLILEGTEPIGADVLVRGSDQIRSTMWETAIDNLRGSLFFGTGRLLYPVEWNNMIHMQSPHNFILELLLSYGLFGAIIHLAILIVIFIIVWKRSGLHLRRNLLLSTGVFVAFAFLQPMLTSYLAIVFYLVVAHQETASILPEAVFRNTQRS